MVVAGFLVYGVVVLFFFFKQKTAYEMLRSLVGSEMCIRDRGRSTHAGSNVKPQIRTSRVLKSGRSGLAFWVGVGKSWRMRRNLSLKVPRSQPPSDPEGFGPTPRPVASVSYTHLTLPTIYSV